MADPNMETAVEDVQRILSYRFRQRAHLYEALQSSRTPLPQATHEPSLALAGQMALEAISWHLFWATNEVKYTTLAHLERAVKYRQELDGDANLLKVANDSGLYPYLATGIEVVCTRMRAILGAVWMDSERNLAEVKHVMRVLGMTPEEGVEGLALSLKNPLIVSEVVKGYLALKPLPAAEGSDSRGR